MLGNLTKTQITATKITALVAVPASYGGACTLQPPPTSPAPNYRFCSIKCQELEFNPGESFTRWLLVIAARKSTDKVENMHKKRNTDKGQAKRVNGSDWQTHFVVMWTQK